VISIEITSKKSFVLRDAASPLLRMKNFLRFEGRSAARYRARKKTSCIFRHRAIGAATAAARRLGRQK
jgi:hypothetical protein